MPRFVCSVCKAPLPLKGGRPRAWKCGPCRELLGALVSPCDGRQPRSPEREERIRRYRARAELRLPLFD